MARKSVEKAVVMARGLGTRMQRGVEIVDLDERTREIAKQGVKAMIPFFDRPFLDYSLQALMSAGFTKVCFVIGPEHSRIREYYRNLGPRLSKVDIWFAEQEKPLGTADAAYASKEFVGHDSFVLVNGDNLYPERDLAALRSLRDEACYCVGFDRDAMTKKSNIEPERVTRFAVVQVDDDWNLIRIVEKPSNPEEYRVDGRIIVSMNLFRFTTDIFEACSRIEPHPTRKEYEITAAVQYLVDHHIAPMKVLYSDEGVLDLTHPADIPPLRRLLMGRSLEF